MGYTKWNVSALQGSQIHKPLTAKHIREKNLTGDYSSTGYDGSTALQRRIQPPRVNIALELL